MNNYLKIQDTSYQFIIEIEIYFTFIKIPLHLRHSKYIFIIVFCFIRTLNFLFLYT